MRKEHEFLRSTPFDLYELYLFSLVAKHGSFTKAAEVAGLTQSAITRQIQALEASLSVNLLERTTRKVKVTSAGVFLYQESARLLGDAEQSLKRLKEEFSGARKEIRVGVSRSIALAHLPGLFHANLRHAPDVTYRVSSENSTALLSALDANELDLGVLCPPKRLPTTLRATHRFSDAFTLIAPETAHAEFVALPRTKKARYEWMSRQNWLLPDERTNTGVRLRAWMQRKGWRIEPAMQLDSFDLILNLVALGMGVGFVPIRALASYPRKRNLRRILLPDRFERELIVAVRKHRNQPKHVLDFVAHVLF